MSTFGLNSLTVPLFELDKNGAILPNVLFHRPWDKLHSRCIEYPFAAAQVGTAQCLLDVGTAKADRAWVEWLEKLPIAVHVTDYDPPQRPFTHLPFHQADVRQLNIASETFDLILAVSVIEHIGLAAPQVNATTLPALSQDGDVEAVRELARLLKPGGRLVMTFPFGPRAGLILNQSARCYTSQSIQRFATLLPAVQLDYYEYQHSHQVALYQEYRWPQPVGKRLWQLLTRRLRPSSPISVGQVAHLPRLPGSVTWRKRPLATAQASHHKHVDGVLCGVWQKPL